MFIKIPSAALYGVHSYEIRVEVNISPGVGYAIVGLPDNAVKESRERVETAIRNTGYNFPRGKIIINLSPADIRKEGSSYDLPIAIGILAASGQIPTDKIPLYLLVGELSLDGSLQPVRGALPIAILARKKGLRGVLLPQINATEAGVVKDIHTYGIGHLRQAVDFLSGRTVLHPVFVDVRKVFEEHSVEWDVDFSEVKGQSNVKRALEIAAAGGHNVIMIGPPGAGKTMLARRLPTILPPLTLEEALETTKIHSIVGKTPEKTGLIMHRPFRAPHHTISDIALVGGGSYPMPGEISLAHNGILFLDELPEFKRNVLEVLRQPLEDRKIVIARARFHIEYPASFMLVASMNPCPCGYYNHPTRSCTCSPGAVQRYLSRISGPLLDRIDIHLEVTPVEAHQMQGNSPEPSSQEIRQRVIQARMRQRERFKGIEGIYTNAQMPPKLVTSICILDSASQQFLERAMEQLQLSGRAYHRILKVARTIADLAGTENIRTEHLAEAISYRSLDRATWGT